MIIPERYPGEDATVSEIMALAEDYRLAAVALASHAPRGASANAPARLCAIHAVELYLNAYLFHAGSGAGMVRGMQHNLADRCKAAGEAVWSCARGPRATCRL